MIEKMHDLTCKLYNDRMQLITMEEFLKKIIGHYGEKAQKEKAVEKLQELICEMYNDLTGKVSRQALITRITDVYYMLNQLCIIYDIANEVQFDMRAKLSTTIRRIERSGE